jgi:glycine/D-amino acid oxidase-like deaminating enzyme/nitrite reductase/ring-hydroxylating ferredoxin subunit
MNAEDERSRSLWMETSTPRLPALSRERQTDVLVIGAGITGLVTAYELARSGRSVAVVDRGHFARGMTARTTAHLSFELDDFFYELIKHQGRDAARQWYQSQAAAVDLFERICREEEVLCDLARVDGYLMAAQEKDIDYLQKELHAAREAGFSDAQWVERDTVSGQDLPAIRFPRQARFHPLKFLNGVIEALGERGAALYEDTAIMKLEEEGEVVTAVTTDGIAIRANQVLVATNSPFHLRIPMHTKQAPYRTYAIAAPVLKGAVPDMLLWDTQEPAYHYVRIQPGAETDMLIVGGEDHKTGTADDMKERISRLEAWARKRWPGIGEVTYAWSGQVNEPADYVGFIGRSPQYQKVYLATGDSGQGMTTGGVAALILPDLMAGHAHQWASLYEPKRMMHHGFGEYVKENLEAARHWIEHLAPGEVASVDEIEPGEGALMKMRGKPVAAYRDEQGQLHLRSAVCTHAGCTVHWNRFEGCWDCPCHGSQFSTDGEVLCGPATKPLDAAEGAEDAPKSRERESEIDRQAPL